ncbi:MAG: Uma2 family endonuclease, partial [Sphingomonadales bacterium]|nr:Uma2 family endonuclease [Sphingomonadales bacterium]
MIAGGTRDHARVQMNLYRFLGAALRGLGCRPFGSDMGVRSVDLSLRYPDVTVDCAGSDGPGDDRVLTAPRVIIEVLSPSTRDHDLKDKPPEYRR